MLRTLCIFLYFLAPLSFAEERRDIFMPLPNTLTTTRCPNGVRTTSTGNLNIIKKPGKPDQYEMNTQTVTPRGLEKAFVQPWNRTTFIYSRWEKGNVFTDAKIISGNLEDITLTVGKSFQGLVEQKVTNDTGSRTESWSVSVKIHSTQKVKFKDKETLAYKILLNRFLINNNKVTYSAEMLYMPEYRQFFSNIVTDSFFPKPSECKLVDTTNIPSKTSSAPSQK